MNIQGASGDVLFYLAKNFLDEEDGLALALSSANDGYIRLFAKYRLVILIILSSLIFKIEMLEIELIFNSYLL